MIFAYLSVVDADTELGQMWKRMGNMQSVSDEGTAKLF